MPNNLKDVSENKDFILSDRHSPGDLVEHGKLLLSKKQYLLAERCTIRAIKTDPGFREAYLLLGHIYRGAGRSFDADICQRSKLPDVTIEKYFSCNNEFIGSHKSESVERLTAHPSVSRELTPARQLDDEVIEKLSGLSVQSNQTHTLKITNGSLWIDDLNIVVWDEAGLLIRNLSSGNSSVVDAVARKRTPKVIQGRVALLADMSSYNYYHWMNDFIPRLDVLTKSGVELQSIDYFAVRALRKPFQEETLSCFDITTNRLMSHLDQTYIQADELYVPVHSSRLGEKQDEWALKFLRDQFRPSKQNAAPHKRLYISRGESGMRGVVNDDEVINLLSTLNFEIVRAETMTVTEQAELFAEANVIVGPHGAGFTNTTFCEAGAKVIELFGSQMEPCFWVVSEILGHEHYVLHCNRVKASVPHPIAHVAKRLECIEVNIEKLKAILEMADVR